MKLIIDFPDEMYDCIKKDTESKMYIIDVIKKGVPYEPKIVIDNAPTVPLPNEQITWEQGYECGYHQAKEDAIRRIAEQYSAHNELIPKWLSVGDMKGGVEND